MSSEDQLSYAVLLLELVSLEARGKALTVKQCDDKLAKLREKLDPDEIADAERMVNKVDRQAKAVLANR